MWSLDKKLLLDNRSWEIKSQIFMKEIFLIESKLFKDFVPKGLVEYDKEAS